MLKRQDIIRGVNGPSRVEVDLDLSPVTKVTTGLHNPAFNYAKEKLRWPESLGASKMERD
jgi:hypothetical protein